MHPGGEASFLPESARYPGVDLRQQMTLLCFCWGSKVGSGLMGRAGVTSVQSAVLLEVESVTAMQPRIRRAGPTCSRSHRRAEARREKRRFRGSEAEDR